MFEFKNWLIDFHEEWSQFFGDYNWYTFRVFLLEFENDAHMGAFEISLVILGLSVRVRWNHTMTADRAELIEQVRQIRDGEIEVTPVNK